MKSYLNLNTIEMGLTSGQKIEYRTIEFDITHYVRRQDSKENYRNGNQIMCILFHYSVITVT